MKQGNNRKRNTILWLVSWAVLFLVVAYSPIGRPDLYVGTSYRLYNQSVNFKGGITNAPKSSFANNDEESIESPSYTAVGINNGDYEGNASQFSTRNSSSTTNYSSATSSNNSNETGYGNAVLALNSGRNSAQGASTAQNNDVSSLSSELTLTSNVENRQAARPNKPTGGRDPGGKDPKNPIPVGEGTWILISIASIYFILKFKTNWFTKSKEI